MTRHVYKYGESEIVGFDSPWRREIYRPFAVAHNEPWNREISERCMATGPDDVTPRHDKVANYDPKCSCCWLNITHSSELHAVRLGTK